MFWSSATRTGKLSLHAVYRDNAFPDLEMLKRFHEILIGIAKEQIPWLVEYIDSSVYGKSRDFRITGCSSAEKKKCRVRNHLVPIRIRSGKIERLPLTKETILERFVTCPKYAQRFSFPKPVTRICLIAPVAKLDDDPTGTAVTTVTDESAGTPVVIPQSQLISKKDVRDLLDCISFEKSKTHENWKMIVGFTAQYSKLSTRCLTSLLNKKFRKDRGDPENGRLVSWYRKQSEPMNRGVCKTILRNCCEDLLAANVLSESIFGSGFAVNEFQSYKDYKKFFQQIIPIDEFKKYVRSVFRLVTNGGIPVCYSLNERNADGVVYKEWVSLPKKQLPFKSTDDFQIKILCTPREFIERNAKLDAGASTVAALAKTPYEIYKFFKKNGHPVHKLELVSRLVYQSSIRLELIRKNECDFIPYLKGKMPNQAKDESVLNLFLGFPLDDYDAKRKIKFEDTNIFKWFRIIAGSEEADIWLQNFIAYKLQYPYKRLRAHFVFYGLPGVGKSSMLQVVSAIFGTNVSIEMDAKTFKSDFNWMQVGKLWCAVDDIDELHGNFKERLTCKDRFYQAKGKDHVRIKVRDTFIFTSNENNPVKVEPFDRRYCFFKVPDTLLGNVQFWNKFYAELEDADVMKSVFEHFARRDVSGFNPNDDKNYPNQHLKQSMQLKHLSSADKFILDFFADNSLFEKAEGSPKWNRDLGYGWGADGETKPRYLRYWVSGAELRLVISEIYFDYTTWCTQAGLTHKMQRGNFISKILDSFKANKKRFRPVLASDKGFAPNARWCVALEPRNVEQHFQRALQKPDFTLEFNPCQK